MSTVLGGVFACPACHSSLDADAVRTRCPGCGRGFESEDGIPVFVVEDETHDADQAAYFDDAVDAEFETERPSGLPRLYAWLLREKFRRGVAGLDLHGASALVVCGGSGMDAEFLAGAGAHVVSSDLSLGAARRARERACRHRVSFEAIVADVERLPFADRSVDVVYVHDGLHHIEDPLAGLREMARVARKAVCVTEPADALVTSLAVKVGLALEREEAGNRVARLRLEDVRRVLEAEGFRVARASRYGMFYRHEPGPAMRMFSRPLFFRLATHGFGLANALLGRAGNKLSVVAVRP